MAHSRSAHLAGIGSAVSMIVPVAVGMAWLGRWNVATLAVVALLSLPWYFMTRNLISLEREHPGWRHAQQAAVDLSFEARTAGR